MLLKESRPAHYESAHIMLLSIQRGSLSNVGGRVIKSHCCLGIINAGERSAKVLIRRIMRRFLAPCRWGRKVRIL